MTADLAHAHALLSQARRQAPDRRRFRRLGIEVRGRMLDPFGEEHDCRTLDVSPGDARMASSARCKAGDKLIIYLQDLGRVEATIIRLLDEASFALRFTVSPHKRDRLTEQLMLMLNPGVAVDDGRRHTRHIGAGTLPVELEDGSVLHCEILDFSLVGVAVKTSRPRPFIGSWVKVGGQFGRVSRYIESGFAVDFQGRGAPSF